MKDDTPKGRPRKLAEQDIIDAVLTEGFAGVTVVPAVARRLEVSTGTLYRYCPTRSHLLTLAWDHVIISIPWPPLTGAWRAVLEEQATAFWNVLAAHPGVVTELARSLVPTAMIEHIDSITVALIERGFAPADALLAVDFVMDLTIDHRRGVENLHGVVNESIIAELADAWAPKDTDEPARAAARAAMRDAILINPYDWYAQKLTLALDGIEHRHH